MRIRWHFILVGTFFLCAFFFVCTGSPEVLAAVRVTAIGQSSDQSFMQRSQPQQDFSQGYARGYTDCSNKTTDDYLFFKSISYQNGYNGGYQTCQQQRQQGAGQANDEGYNAGYQTCQQQHKPLISAYSSAAPSTLSPEDDSYQNAYGPSWQRGYNDCQNNYGN